MSVWYCIPAKRPLAESTLPRWREAGYKIAIMRERADGDDVPYDLVEWVDRYHGWATSVNFLVRLAMEKDREATWFVTGGDDYLPDASFKPEDIAEQCSDYFYASQVREAFLDAGMGDPTAVSGGITIHKGGQIEIPAGITAAQAYRLIEGIRASYGVMQPTGDRWGENDGAVWSGHSPSSAVLDRICGSPWLGREFCRRFNGGRGPLWPEYWHMFADEELHDITVELGLLWQRRDIVQTHEHWSRPRLNRADMPEWAAEMNSTVEWERSKKLFNIRKAGGFPGHEPLEPIITIAPEPFGTVRMLPPPRTE